MHFLGRAQGVCRFLDKGDARLTSNMHKHAKKCWGEEVVTSADNAKNANKVWATMVMGALNPQSITAAFKQKGKGKVNYSHRQHTKTEARAKIV